MAATTLDRNTDFTARPSMRRIAGMSSAMALHVVVFGILLMPVAIPIVKESPLPPPDPPTVVDVITPVKAIPVPPIPRPPQIVQPPPKPIEQAPVLPAVERPVIAERVVPPLAIDVPIAPAAPPLEPSGPSGPIEAGQLAYLYAPPPRYPPIATRKGWSGVVVLRVLVDARGLPEKILVERSSGRPVLDVAAAKQVRTWRFRAAVREGEPVKAWASVPVEFTLLGR